MRFISSIALILLIFFQTGYKPLVVMSWKMNQRLITQKYCVNKDRPAMHCDGKCYLARQLRKLDWQEQNERSGYPITDQKLKHLDAPFINTGIDLHIIYENTGNSKKRLTFTTATQHYQYNFLNDCFHPPCKKDLS